MHLVIHGPCKQYYCNTTILLYYNCFVLINFIRIGANLGASLCQTYSVVSTSALPSSLWLQINSICQDLWRPFPQMVTQLETRSVRYSEGSIFRKKFLEKNLWLGLGPASISGIWNHWKKLWFPWITFGVFLKYSTEHSEYRTSPQKGANLSPRRGMGFEWPQATQGAEG